MSKKRTLTFFLVLLLMALAAAFSWILGSRIQSPAEAAARTAPPTPSPILVPIEERRLSSDIVTRGTARFGLPQSISVAPSSLKADAGIITSLPVRDTQYEEGDVLLTISGRPLFVLQGSTPAYRDLVPGISGADVLQLEEALQRLGFDAGPVDGNYDERTAAAVGDWYTASGFEPFRPTADQLVIIRDLEEALAAAKNDLLTAEEVAAAIPLTVSAAKAEADAANKAAEAEVSAARGAQAIELAQAAALATQLAGEAAIQSANNDLAAAEREARAAADLVAQITTDLEDAQRKTGVQVPVDEVVFLPELPVRIEEVGAAIGDPASGPVLTVTNNQLAIDSSLPLDEAQLVKPGMIVAIDEPDLGIKAAGVVTRVASTPGTDGVDGFHIYFETFVEEASTPLEGFSLRLTIPVESTGGTVTAVPISALSLAPDGRSRVQVEDNGALNFVTVEPGLAADGYVEVTPVDGMLQAGQLVVIGFEPQ